jgi:hypothetical protein
MPSSPSPHLALMEQRVLILYEGETPVLGVAPLALYLTKTGNHAVANLSFLGHGNSSASLETHARALFYGQIFELLSNLGWSTPHLLGFSMDDTISASFVAICSHIAEFITTVARSGLMRKCISWLDRLMMGGDVNGSDKERS